MGAAEQNIVTTTNVQVDTNPAIRFDTKSGIPGSMILDIRKNGGSQLAGTGTDFDVGSMNSDIDRVNVTRNPTSNYSTANIAEIIIYNRSLEAQESDIVFNYLSLRYNISVTP